MERRLERTCGILTRFAPERNLRAVDKVVREPGRSYAEVA